jgi:hypothetical protein
VSTNAIAWKRVKALNRKMGERFVHATTTSTGEWWWWHCTRHDGSTVLVNTRTLETESSDGRTTTVRLLRDRDSQAYSGAGEWLAELDRRDAELRSAPRCPTCGLTVKIPASKGSHGCSDPWHEESE